MRIQARLQLGRFEQLALFGRSPGQSVQKQFAERTAQPFMRWNIEPDLFAPQNRGRQPVLHEMPQIGPSGSIH